MGHQENNRPGMVDWYAPLELLDTGIRTLVSVMLGQRIDTRLLTADGEDSESIFDYRDCASLVFDYTADTGDGWDATYTLARQMSAPEKRPGGEERRSDFLILGGDEVYPVASRDAYKNRLVDPYRKAAESLGQAHDPAQLKDLYLIPGNHDWYDSLASFNRRFCCGRWVGAYRTRQKRSYFILQLPENWHIWATDIQLGKDIDATQFQFFKDYAANLSPLDKVILLAAEPGVVYGREADAELLATLKALEYQAERWGARVPLRIAGDVHNYQRYERSRLPEIESWPHEAYSQTQLVSGGGGAFLHPTHAIEMDDEHRGGFELKARYPDAKTSEKLSLQNRFFARQHLPMTGFFGLVFMLMFWTLSKDSSVLRFPVEHPMIFTMMLLVMAATTLFSLASVPKVSASSSTSDKDKKLRQKAMIAGFLHGVSLIVVALLAWKTGHVVSGWLIHDPNSFLGIYLPRFLDFLIAGFAAASLFGGYLTWSLNVLGLHRNEAFSALAYPHHKHFLRCRIDENGDLRVRVMGLPKTAGEHDQNQVRLEEVEEIVIS